MHVQAFVACRSRPHRVWPPSLPPRPPATALHLTPPCSSLQGQSQKTGMRREGTAFRPCGGQSLQITQANLGPSPPGACAQQALLSPPRGLRSLKWAPRLQTAETCLCPLAPGGHWWLTPSLCLWTRHARDGELHLRRPSQIQQKTVILCQKLNCCQKCFSFSFFICVQRCQR